jgi:hypothetical protein
MTSAAALNTETRLLPFEPSEQRSCSKVEGARNAGSTGQRAGSYRAVIIRSAAPRRSNLAHRAERDPMNGLSEGIEVNRFYQVHVEACLS